MIDVIVAIKVFSYLHILSGKVSHFFCELSTCINWTNWVTILFEHTIAQTDTIIILPLKISNKHQDCEGAWIVVKWMQTEKITYSSKEWSLMNHSCSTVIGYVVVTHDTKSTMRFHLIREEWDFRNDFDFKTIWLSYGLLLWWYDIEDLHIFKQFPTLLHK